MACSRLRSVIGISTRLLQEKQCFKNNIGALYAGFSTSSRSDANIKNVTVFGGGLMGAGIAQVAAATNHNVMLVDQTNALLEKALRSIERSLQRVAKKQFQDDENAGKAFVKDTMSRLNITLDIPGSVEAADLVIEAIVEDMRPKHKLFSAIDGAAPPQCIFATNTSSLSVGEVGSSTNRRDRFGGLHFFNPVPMMKLVEVIRTPATSDETFDTLYKFGKEMGKVPVSCKDTPGFVVNRLLVPYMAEAVRMLQRGDASPKDIDTAMKLGAVKEIGTSLVDFESPRQNTQKGQTSQESQKWRETRHTCETELADARQLREALIAENSITELKWKDEVTQLLTGKRREAVISGMEESEENGLFGSENQENPPAHEDEETLKSETDEGERDTSEFESKADATENETKETTSSECVSTKQGLEEEEGFESSQAKTMEHASEVSEEKAPDAVDVEEGSNENVEAGELVERLRRERDELSASLTASSQQCSELAAKCDGHEQQIQKLRLELEETRIKNTELGDRSKETQQQNVELRERVGILEERIRALENENRTLREQKEAVDGLNQGEIINKVEAGAVEQQTVVEESSHKAETSSVIQEEEESVGGEMSESRQPVAPARKAPSLSSTAPMPFKRHSLTGGAHPASHPRSRSFDHGTRENIERRGSFGSDASAESNPEATAHPKAKFLQKKLSASHLDALKPRPFGYKPGSQAGFESKADSTGSASDNESLKEGLDSAGDAAKSEGSDIVDGAVQDTPQETKPKVPPETKPKPKPRRASEGMAPLPQATHGNFKSGFSYREYMSGIRPPVDGEEQTDEALVQNGDSGSHEKQEPEVKGELV